MRKARDALTLLELLLVLAILAVFMGLLFPALHKVRQAAARMQCSNHLRQIGLAMHQHHDTKGAFPQGGTNPPGSSSARPLHRAEWAWAYHLLPFLEQENLHREANFAQIDSTPVAVFYCPARRNAVALYGYAKIDYAGNAGTFPNGADGVIQQGDRPILRMGDIADGTSTTLLVSEKRLNPAKIGKTIDDNEPYNRAGWNNDYEVYRVALGPPRRDTSRFDYAPYLEFGSSHQQGLNCLFVDGSVRHMPYQVSLPLWQSLCIRNDGQPVGNLN
jgi:prepilin-type N-terminal cleavage/methylation domain-containing protein/prepilin-type processing-associated H-X9-DG protein